MTYEPAVAATVVGLATFELWKVWNETAPSLSELRHAGPESLALRQRLLDSDITVGTLAGFIGVTYAVLTKDATVLVIMLAFFGALSVIHHQTLNTPTLAKD
jgi:hypothetical protein